MSIALDAPVKTNDLFKENGAEISRGVSRSSIADGSSQTREQHTSKDLVERSHRLISYSSKQRGRNEIYQHKHHGHKDFGLVQIGSSRLSDRTVMSMGTPPMVAGQPITVTAERQTYRIAHDSDRMPRS